ncbi:methyltransferase [Clostridium sp. PL3]|uniref:Methyltransferase n=1 Tax=Clostridium thailandense TaxID=2794346 RepID=A0A949TP02_9CLOT|nr:uroporphyrinogen decarboxylase family protein [Clostridium thailandense]MBV7273947.1 methyltransferase [Clostridium thailandense]
MNHFERFYATIERKPVDRPASWLGIPDHKAYKGLFDYFKVSNLDELKAKIDDDAYPVELPYHSPNSNAIYAAFNFAKKNFDGVEDARTLTAPGFFEDYSDPDLINDFDWPDPEKYISKEECLNAVEKAPKDRPTLGVIWSAHFQDTCAAFGMETALVKMLIEPEMYEAVDKKILDFYLRANEIFFEATKGKLHAVLIGNDLGSQAGLMLSPDSIRKFVIPGAKKLVEQAKSYGLKVLYHSCGSIVEVIPDLIGAGVDVIHPIQALAKGMDPHNLKEKYGDIASFCGGVDAQNLLVHGTPQQVRDKVFELRQIFPTGLIISPSHEAILPDIRPENVAALFDAVKETI